MLHRYKKVACSISWFAGKLLFDYSIAWCIPSLWRIPSLWPKPLLRSPLLVILANIPVNFMG